MVSHTKYYQYVNTCYHFDLLYIDQCLTAQFLGKARARHELRLVLCSMTRWYNCGMVPSIEVIMHCLVRTYPILFTLTGLRPTDKL